MSTLSERLRTGVDDPGIFDEAADELDRLTARVAELEQLVAAVASAPFPIHDYVTEEQWKEACHIYYSTRNLDE